MSVKIDPVMIDVPMPVVTPRLLLRPVKNGDGAVMDEAQAETWDDLCQWMAWTDDGHNPQLCETIARKAEAKFIMRDDIWLVGIERETNRPVIWCGLHRFDWTTRRFEIGYWVRKSAQGKGYATEATNALIRYALGALDARRVEISHADGNDRSRNVIEKLGFERESMRRQVLPLPGRQVADAVYYTRFNTDGLPDLDVRWGPP